MSCSALLAARCHGAVRLYRIIGRRELLLCEACVAVARRLGVPLVLEG
jgi:hypothetical protein